jgi:phospholipid/cholesterol/gamma-HCH transport system substrate-binding protein
VQLNDVLTSLDQPTRDNLRSMVRSSGMVTEDTRDEVDNLLTGLGSLGRDGSGALAAAADQSQDLAELTANMAAVLRALDQRQGQIVQLAEDSDAITASMASEKENIEELIRELPPFLESAQDATKDLQDLAEPLDDVAQNLDEGAPYLTAALEELPATTKELRLLVPDLQRVVDRAPATLKRTPKFVDETRPVVRSLSGLLQDVNPMLAYMKPYGPDIAANFRNISLGTSSTDENGRILRVKTVFTAHSVNSPIKGLIGNVGFNPMPAPGQAQDNPGVTFEGNYPHVVRDVLPK